MTERRALRRYRAEVAIEFTPSESKITGRTWDVSLGGLFVRSSWMPEKGDKLFVTLRFNDGRQLMLQGQVVRTFHPSALLRNLLPTGFALALKSGETYKRFVESVAASSDASV